MLFLTSEVPLLQVAALQAERAGEALLVRVEALRRPAPARRLLLPRHVQGYLAYKKLPLPRTVK